VIKPFVHWNNHTFPLHVLTAIAVVIAGSGCSQTTKGPQRYTVQGQVTFRGEPVPVGRISFEPDPAAGIDGPPGVAEIVNGRYETDRRFGTITGRHIVRIDGYEAPGPEPLGPDDALRPLFREYQTTVEIPAEPSTQDFDVPEQRSGKPLKR
jgi:hypothetical protein